MFDLESYLLKTFGNNSKMKKNAEVLVKLLERNGYVIDFQKLNENYNNTGNEVSYGVLLKEASNDRVPEIPFVSETGASFVRGQSYEEWGSRRELYLYTCSKNSTANIGICDHNKEKFTLIRVAILGNDGGIFEVKAYIDNKNTDVLSRIEIKYYTTDTIEYSEYEDYHNLLDHSYNGLEKLESYILPDKEAIIKEVPDDLNVYDVILNPTLLMGLVDTYGTKTDEAKTQGGGRVKSYKAKKETTE